MDLLKILLICLFLTSCSVAENTGTGCFGYWEDRKPWRGSNWQNKEYIRPYRQCVESGTSFRNIFP